MKKPSELIVSRFESRDALKGRATTFKRISGGISNLLRSDFMGLTTTEIRTLRQAVGLLDEMAGVVTTAAKLADARQRQEAQRLVAVKRAMSGNFMALKSPEERVVFIAAANSRALERVASMSDLEFHFNEEIDSMAYAMATRGDLGRDPSAVVSEWWEKFVGARNQLAIKHAVQIKKLEVGASRA